VSDQRTKRDAVETIESRLLRELDTRSLIEAFAVAAKIQDHVVNRAAAEHAEHQSDELWETESRKVRRMLVRQLDRLPFEHCFALLGDLLVFVCLDGKTTVEEFERVLDHMRVLYASCKGENDQHLRPC